MKLLMIYCLAGLVLVGIDMIVFSCVDVLDKPEFTSITDLFVLLLFAIDIPFMMATNFITFLLYGILDLVSFAFPSDGFSLSHLSPTQWFFLHLTIDVVVCVILAVLFHLCVYLPVRLLGKVLRKGFLPA